MWDQVAPQLVDAGFRLVLMDLLGFGKSDHEKWSAGTHAEFGGHARDIAAVAQAFSEGVTLMVGHSVAGMLGVLADLDTPQAFHGHIMVSPSPCYRNEPGYAGGFDPEVLESLVAMLETDAAAATQALGVAILGTKVGTSAMDELSASFCTARAEALGALARATFMGDVRPTLVDFAKPVLVIQGEMDPIAPPAVGHFIESRVRDCTFAEIRCDGHSPHVSHPVECANAVIRFASSFQSMQVSLH